MGVRLGGGEGKLSPVEVLCLMLGLAYILMVVMAFQIHGLEDDRDADRRLIAGLLEHEVDQAQMLCDAGLSEAEGCEGDG